MLREVQRLIDEGRAKKSDFVNWLRERGVKVSTRTPWSKILSQVKASSAIKVRDLEEFISSFKAEAENYEREIIIREKGSRASVSSTTVRRRSRSAEAVHTIEYPVMDVVLELWPGQPADKILEQLYEILDELGVRYKKAKSLTQLLSSLSSYAQQQLYQKLVEIRDWRAFQEEVYQWIKANIELAHDIKRAGGVFQQEYTDHGASGVNYRFDIYGYAESRGFLSTRAMLLLAECKKYSEPLSLDHVLVFYGKALDMVERYRPTDAFLAIFSDSGFSERAIKYVNKWGVRDFPVKLYEKTSKGFRLVAETRIQ